MTVSQCECDLASQAHFLFAEVDLDCETRCVATIEILLVQNTCIWHLKFGPVMTLKAISECLIQKLYLEVGVGSVPI